MSGARSESSSASTNRIRFTNASPGRLALTIEPWGDVHEISAGTSVEVLASGPAGGVLEIEVRPEGLVVYGWTGSTVDIHEASDSGHEG